MTRPCPEPAASGSRGRVPTRYLALFMLVYAIQGVVFAYFSTFNQGYMMEAGVDEATVGFVQFLVLLPFAFKFLVAPISDRISPLGLGHRRPYIVLGLGVQLLGLIALGGIDPGAHLATFAATALVTVIGLAIYDTCTDGLILDMTPEPDRERIQGLVIFARFFTATVMTWAFGQWLGRFGNGPRHGYGVLWACAGLTLIPLALGVALREPRRRLDHEEFSWKALRVLIRPRSVALLAFGTFYAIVSWGVEMNLPILHRALGYGEAAYGTFGAALKLGRAAGALAMPLGVAWLGRRLALILGILGLAGSELAQAFLQPGEAWMAGSLAFGFGFANGWIETLFYVLAMKFSDPRMAASTFALFMAVTNLSTMGSWIFAEAKARAFGDAFAPTFQAAAVLTLLALPLVPELTSRRDRTSAVEGGETDA